MSSAFLVYGTCSARERITTKLVENNMSSKESAPDGLESISGALRAGKIGFRRLSCGGKTNIDVLDYKYI